MYVHNSLTEFSRTRSEYRNFDAKVKKVAQLTQKLYNLTLLEHMLNTKLKLGMKIEEQW